MKELSFHVSEFGGIIHFTAEDKESKLLAYVNIHLPYEPCFKEELPSLSTLKDEILTCRTKSKP